MYLAINENPFAIGKLKMRILLHDLLIGKGVVWKAARPPVLKTKID